VQQGNDARKGSGIESFSWRFDIHADSSTDYQDVIITTTLGFEYTARPDNMTLAGGSVAFVAGAKALFAIAITVSSVCVSNPVACPQLFSR
jgi:hypothetical protein